MTTLEPTASIGIFDSGSGGLTVMRAIREKMPYENIIYFGDTEHLPYGSKSAETILRYTLKNASFLTKQGIKILVIACNTACSAALDQVRNACAIPVIGISEQGVEEVARLLPTKKIGILATRATINSGMYQEQILSRSPKTQLFAISCPLFVPLVEEGYVDHPICSLVVREYLQPLKSKGIEGALLGCTHYPLLQPSIQQELGPDVVLINPATACAERTQQLLSEKNLLNSSLTPPQYQFFVSDDPEKFRLHGKVFLNYPINHVWLEGHTKKENA